MTGIVIVSHHPDLAHGLKVLALQMVSDDVPIAVAAGIDDPDDPIGTDAMKILQAIEEVYSDDGVIVFMDLGSAILSTDMALEFLEEDQRKNVYLSAAPIVEGVLSAVTQAAAGASVKSVLEEANNALNQKRAALNDDTAPGEDTDTAHNKDAVSIPNDATRLELTIANTMGLHARPAARLVQAANKFRSDIFIQNDTKDKSPASAKSINQVLLQEIRQGDTISLWFDGADEDEAREEITRLADDHFGEKEITHTSDSSKTGSAEPDAHKNENKDGTWNGTVISPGMAIGPAIRPVTLEPEIPKKASSSPDEEWTKLQESISDIKNELNDQKEKLEQHDAEASEIFDVHLLLIEDSELLESVHNAISDEGVSAAYAWKHEVDKVIASYSKMKESLIRERADDLREVSGRVLYKLLNIPWRKISAPDTPSVLVIDELLPSDIEHLKSQQIVGVAAAKGSPTSHASILLRSTGIPSIVALGTIAVEMVEEGDDVVVDAEHNRFYPHPAKQQLKELSEQNSRWKKRSKLAEEHRKEPAVTADGTRLTVWANIIRSEETETAVEKGAEGVGLYRTEYLFLNRDEAPDLEEQRKHYRTALEHLGNDQALTIRTMDIGGDKKVAYLNQLDEQNPNLGWRGIRYHLDHPTLLRTQLQAIALAAHDTGHPVQIMFPMVTSISEYKQARSLLDEAVADIPDYDDELISTGIMVEIPSAAVLIDKVLPYVDFVSIGTNDLVQYTLAADRNNEKVQAIANPLHPAFLTLLNKVVKAAEKTGTPAAMCGEMAGNPRMTPLLAGLGLREFSMGPGRIPEFKRVSRNLDIAKAQKLAETALACEGPEDVARLLS
jgi:phosphocarrier protein FPr